MTRIVKGYTSSLNCPPAKNRRLNLKYFNFGLLAIVVVLSALYLVNINDLTVQGFVLQDLKIKAASAGSVKMDNEERVNMAQSYYSLSARTQKLDLVAIDDVEYLTVNHSAMARR